MDKVLFGDKWMQMLLRDGWYTFAHNVKGDGVAVLGFRDSARTDRKDNDMEFMIRLEHTPCHGEGLRRTSLTGTVEGGLTATETAVKEMLEESGYTITEGDLIGLGWVYPSKFSDYKQHLFAVDLTDKTPGKIKGDGTKGEEGAGVTWVPFKEALLVQDPSIQATIARLML